MASYNNPGDNGFKGIIFDLSSESTFFVGIKFQKTPKMSYFATMINVADCIDYPNNSLHISFEIALFSNFQQKMKSISHPLDLG